MNKKMRVLVTGATGYLAGQLLPAFRERYDLRLLDIRKENHKGEILDGIEIANLLQDDAAVLKQYFVDIDAVVHLGFNRPIGTDTQSLYDGEKLNIDMMQRVYQLSLENGVRRVVAASTNQAARWYERPYYQKLKDHVSPEEYPRADNFYGWAKAAYESLGFLYACGSLGRKLEMVQLRIVAPREIEGSVFVNRPREQYIRDLAGYISERDNQQLFCKSLETENIEDEYGVPFHIFYGVSDNARKFWSISNARKVINYQPQDDSEIKFAKDISMLLK